MHFSMDVETDGSASPATDRLLVLDEPTVFLAHDEVEQLYRLIRNLVRQQPSRASVLFVSHDLDEVKTYVQNLFYGAALVVAVVFSQAARRRRLRRAAASLVK